MSKSNYNREEDLKSRFNNSLTETLQLPRKDYYGGLSFPQLLTLKGGYARIHDIVTLKLTVALANRISAFWSLGKKEKQELITAVNKAHPNAAGFDINSKAPNLIGEVKGCIPMNDGDRFGAAQVTGLRNDVLQMFGIAPPGKATSDTSKLKREGRVEAIKLLGLYDSEKVRAATAFWRKSFLKSKSWKPLEKYGIEDFPTSRTTKLSPDVVYIVYLIPRHASSIAKVS